MVRQMSDNAVSVREMEAGVIDWYSAGQVPAIIDRAGGQARKRFLEFFTATIRNDNTRMAYARAVGAFFYDGSKDFDAKEIVCETGEVKKLDELLVTVPDNNATFTSLAKSLAEKLPRADDPPSDKSAKQDWQNGRRKRLAEIVAVKAEKARRFVQRGFQSG